MRILAILIGCGAVLGAAVWLPPANWLSGQVLGGIVVHAAILAAAAVYAAVAGLPILGLTLVALHFAKRRQWVGPVALVYARVFAYILLPVAVTGVFVFFAEYALATGLLVAIAWLPVRWKTPRSRFAAGGWLVGFLVAAFAAAPLASLFGNPSEEALRRGWRAVRYSEESRVYDAAFAGDAGDLYVGAGYGGGLLRIAAADAAIRSEVHGLRRPERLTLLDKRIVVSNNAVGHVDEPDAVSFALPDLTDRRDINSTSTSRVIDVAVDGAARRLFLIDELQPVLAVWDLDRMTPEADVVLESTGHISPHDVLFDAASRRLLVCCWVLGQDLYVVDADRLALVEKVRVGASATAIAVDDARNRAYIARPLHRRIDVFDTRTWTRTDSLRTIPGVRQMIWIPEADLLVSGGYFTGEVEIRRPVEPEQRLRIEGFPRVRGLRYDAERDELIVCCRRGVFGLPLSRILGRLDEAVTPARAASRTVPGFLPSTRRTRPANSASGRAGGAGSPPR